MAEKKQASEKRPEQSGQKPVVVPMPVKAPPASSSLSGARKRHALPWYKRLIPLSALAMIALPTLLVGLYLILFASSRYATEVRFAVRGQEVQTVDAVGLMGALGGAPNQNTSDSYILVDYLLSRELVTELDQLVDLRSLYSASHIDWLSRFDSELEIERLLSYWLSMTNIHFDSAKGTITVEVSAYRPDHAELIAQHVVRLASQLVNKLSSEAREDALRGTLADVERAEFRVRMLRAAMRQFREDERIADPIAGAASTQEMIARLQGELSRIDTEMSSALAFLSPDAPSVVVLRAQREAVIEQLARARSEIDGSARAQGGGAVASMLSDFEELEAERQFAQQAYTNALASLERARVEADRKQRYLAVFVPPRAPELARYPRILRSIFLTLVFAFLAWAISVLVYYGLREHMA